MESGDTGVWRYWSLEILDLTPKSLVALEVVAKVRKYMSGCLTLPFIFKLRHHHHTCFRDLSWGLSCCQLLIGKNQNVTMIEVTEDFFLGPGATELDGHIIYLRVLLADCFGCNCPLTVLVLLISLYFTSATLSKTVNVSK